MKRTLKYALSTVLATALVLPAFAADNFPDVPDNHWAFEALARMKKEGLLIGYPDGLYRGARPATRYELAVACHAVFMALKNVTDGLESQIGKMGPSTTSSGGPSQADFDAMKASMDAMKSDMAGMKGWGDDIAALKKMSSTFEKELSSMGVDVEAMKKSLGDLDARVKALEGRKLPIDISGDANFVTLGGYSQSGTFGITVDGRPTGFGKGSYNGGSLDSSPKLGVMHDLTVLHEGAVNVAGTNDTGPKWAGTVVIGNMVNGSDSSTFSSGDSGPFGTMSKTMPGVPFGEGDENIYLDNFAVKFDSSVGRMGFNATVGRMGLMVSPMIFARPDTTPYYSNSRWDDGAYRVDGGKIDFMAGRTALSIFLAKSINSTVDGFEVLGSIGAGRSTAATQPEGAGRVRGFADDLLNINTVLGVTAKMGLGDKGNLNLAYLWLAADNTTIVNTVEANGVNVYGGDVNFNAGKVGISAGYSKSDVVYNTTSIVNKDNDAWWVNGSFGHDKWGAKVGYKQINPYFGAPGDWGRIGIWQNPTDIKGGYGDLWFKLSDSMNLSVNGGFYTGTGKDAAGLGTNDKVSNVLAQLNYKLGGGQDLMLGYEEVFWDLKDREEFTGGKPLERWYSVGLGFHLGDNAKLNFLWQISDYDSKGVAGWNPFASSAATTAKGGLITTQLTVKY